MIDTITLFQEGKNGKDFNINLDNFYSTSSPISSSFDNKPTHFYNTFYEDNKKKSKAINIRYDENRRYLLTTFSAPKLINGHSLETFELDDSDKLIDILENRLKGIVQGDFRNMNLSRLDITKNVSLSQSIPIYIDALKEAVSVNKRYKVTKYNSESIVIANNSRRFTLYDKVIEGIKSKELSRNGTKKLGNILRMELQLKKAQHIETAFKKKFTFDDILTDGMFATFKNYLVTLYDSSFCNYGQYEIFRNDLALIDIVSSISKRNLLKNFIIRQNADVINFDFKHYEDLLKYKGMSSAGIRKALKSIEQLRYLATNRVSDVIDEIRLKLVA